LKEALANNSIGNRWLVVFGAILIQLALGAEIVMPRRGSPRTWIEGAEENYLI